MRTWLKRLGTLLLFTLVALCLAPTLIPPFLDRIYHRGPPSDHYDGQRFFNPDGPTRALGSPAAFMNRFLSSSDRAVWPETVPVQPTRPPARLADGEMRVTWVGHATVLIQAGGINILTDPIWSERASPFSFVGPKRVRAPGIRFEDLPRIDLVVVSHNHYDHMDLPTLKRLWERDRPTIVASLGNDTVIAGAGVPARALDWGQQVAGRGWGVQVLRNHHWSSRWGTDRNRALWSAFKIDTPAGAIFFAGDTGWGDGSWVREAAREGPYRLAIIPIGAYEPRDFMKTHHINPEEAVRMFETIRPAMALGVHWGTFQLTFEPIDEPRQKLAALTRARGITADRFVATEAGRGVRVPAM